MNRMDFNISFTYMDGHIYEVKINSDDMENFIECMGKGEVYFNPKRGVGLWLPFDKIRHFNIESVDAMGNRIKEADKDSPGKDGDGSKKERGTKVGDTSKSNAGEGVLSLPISEIHSSIEGLDIEAEELKRLSKDELCEAIADLDPKLQEG
jgi:hypothetical protein